MKINVKDITYLAIGIALFVIVVSLPICSILEKTARKLRYE